MISESITQSEPETTTQLPTQDIKQDLCNPENQQEHIKNDTVFNVLQPVRQQGEDFQYHQNIIETEVKQKNSLESQLKALFNDTVKQLDMLHQQALFQGCKVENEVQALGPDEILDRVKKAGDILKEKNLKLANGIEFFQKIIQQVKDENALWMQKPVENVPLPEKKIIEPDPIIKRMAINSKAIEKLLKLDPKEELKSSELEVDILSDDSSEVIEIGGSQQVYNPYHRQEQLRTAPHIKTEYQSIENTFDMQFLDKDLSQRLTNSGARSLLFQPFSDIFQQQISSTQNFRLDDTFNLKPKRRYTKRQDKEQKKNLQELGQLLELQDNKIGCITNRNSVIYLDKENTITAVVMNPTQGDVIHKQELFKLDDQRMRAGFGLVQLNLKKFAGDKNKETVVVAFGAKDTGYFYEYKDDKLITIDDVNLGNLQYYSWVIYTKDKIFVTGGKIGDKVTKKTYCLQFSLKANKEVLIKKNTMPELTFPRYGHSSIILENKIYVIFGRNIKDDYTSNFESWNIQNGQKIFSCFSLRGKTLPLFKPMLFLEDFKILFFGGNQNPEVNDSPLYYLDFSRNSHGKGKIRAATYKVYDDMINIRNTSFSQTVKNKIGDEGSGKWCFIDDSKGWHLIDLRLKSADYYEI